jgi:protein arginine kinase
MLWYEYKNKTAALSTRVRLARNLDGVPFPLYLNKENLKSTNEKIADVISEINFKFGKFRRIDMQSLGEIEAYSMVERHIISPQFAAIDRHKILLLNDDESISIMVGEEDHLRIQAIKSGLCLKETYELCCEVETEIGKRIKFAFSDRLGYLTECPTNLGTGMRASVMLHLPVLESSRELKSIASAVGKIGLTFRGFYGEGSDSKTSIYQLSNQITLGVSEEGALENLNNIALEIIAKENNGIEKLDKVSLEDTVARSFGILKYARRLNTDEMMKHISVIMLGNRAGVIELPETIVPMKLFVELQPAMIKRLNGDLEANERDKIRTKLMRETLKVAEV